MEAKLALFSIKGIVFWSLLTLAGSSAGFLVGAKFFGQEMVEKRSLQELGERQQQSLAELQQQLTRLQASASVDKASLTSVQGSLTSLQQRLAQSEEELWLYRQLVPDKSENDPQALGSSVRLSAGDRPGEITYKLLIFQHERKQNKEIKVGYVLTVQGADDAIFQVPGTDASVGARKATFKYFHVEEGRFQLPDGFEPETLGVSIWQDKDVSSANSTTIPWQLTGTEL